jgi:anti-anti-sigma factor
MNDGSFILRTRLPMERRSRLARLARTGAPWLPGASARHRSWEPLDGSLDLEIQREIWLKLFAEQEAELAGFAEADTLHLERAQGRASERAMPLNEWSDDIVIAEMFDEPQFSEDVAALMRRLDSESPRPPDVIVNMQGVTYLNSSNIAQLLRLRKKVSGVGKRLRICSVRDSVWGVLLITGLDKIFEFTDDVSTSLASLQMGL